MEGYAIECASNTLTNGRNKWRMADTKAGASGAAAESFKFVSMELNLTRRGKFSHKHLDMGKFPTYDAPCVGKFYTL